MILKKVRNTTNFKWVDVYGASYVGRAAPPAFFLFLSSHFEERKKE